MRKVGELTCSCESPKRPHARFGDWEGDDVKLSEVTERAMSLRDGDTLEIPFYDWPLAEIDIMLSRGRTSRPTLQDVSMFRIAIVTGFVRVVRGPEPKPVDLDVFKRWVKEQHRTWYEHELEKSPWVRGSDSLDIV